MEKISEADALALEDKAEHRYAVNDGVKIHYARYGEGPLVVFLHGFPDYWLTWRACPVCARIQSPSSRCSCRDPSRAPVIWKKPWIIPR